jgi:DNA repair exonuclease SbcCD ATPase subunit
MKKIIAAAVALIIICVGATAFAAPKNLAAKDNPLIQQINQAKATLHLGKNEINQMRVVNHKLAAQIRNTMAAKGIKAVPSLKAQLDEIKALLKKELASVKDQKPVNRDIAALLRQAQAEMRTKDFAAALNLYQQAITRQDDLQKMIAASTGRLNEILAKANAYAAAAAAERQTWEQFRTQAQAQLATIEANNAQISAIRQQISATFERMRTKLSTALNSPPVPATLTAYLPKFKVDLTALKTQLSALFDGQIKAKMEAYRAHNKAGEYSKALDDLSAVIQLQQKILSALPGIRDAALALETNLIQAIAGSAV